MKETPDFEMVLKKLSDLFSQKKINYILIGAVVPRLLIDFREKNGKGYGIRKTTDVDFAVRASSWKNYQNLMKKLKKEGLKKRKGEPEHRLFLENTPVDLIPYDPSLIEENDILVWPESGHQMNMTGFDLLFKNARIESFWNTLDLPVPPLPLTVFAKCLAFQDRNAVKDLTDILYMLAHYEEITVSERRYEPGIPDSIGYDFRGAYLMGKDLKAYNLPKSSMNTINDLEQSVTNRVTEAVKEINLKPEQGAVLFKTFLEGVVTK